MRVNKEIQTLLLFILIFILFYFLPVGYSKFDKAVFEAFELTKWYAREHVLFCLIPAFFIAGAISVFVKQESVLRYLGSGSNKILSYGVASISGAILAVCSCTVLPLFAGIYNQGAGIGPASTFLYSGPAINVLAIILSAKILGLDIGFARAIFAILFSIIIGLLMQYFFSKSDTERLNNIVSPKGAKNHRKLWQDIVYFVTMVAILVFANWGNPSSEDNVLYWIFINKWILTTFFSIILALILIFWFKAKWQIIILSSLLVLSVEILFANVTLSFLVGLIGFIFSLLWGSEELKDWLWSTWEFSKQILPLLFVGVLLSGFALGRPGSEGIIPSEWVSMLLGGNSLLANFFASVIGTFMYFATLTEVPIVQGLLGSGMGKGPALALLLSGPALSLPSILVINRILGFKKTLVFVVLVIIFSTLIGFVFGSFF
ncbi:MAG: permease [Ignavibacteria bacterium]|nr:permease [Ignavibacteria bacterium]